MRRLVSELDCSWRLASILVNRGITDPEAGRRMLQPDRSALHDPATVPDLEPALDRLDRALDREEEIVVYADRDVDGVSGGAILVTLLRDLSGAGDLGRTGDLGGTVRPYVPGKWDGYGVHADAVREFVDEGVDLLVTVDCGTTALEAVELANRGGLDVVVTDHHKPEERLPDAVACVNPRRADSTYPNDALAGGAIAFKLGQALVEKRERSGKLDDYCRYALPLAAIATLGDYVLLTPENRAIAREGFDGLSDCGIPGLVTLVEHLDVATLRDVSWSLVPLLNAGQEATEGSLALDLLLESDADRIAAIVEQLETYREQRSAERRERQAYLEACVAEQCDPETDLVFLVETDRYVGGVALSRVASQWGRPVIAYREKDGQYRAGGRSVGDVDLRALYERAADLLEEYWGHPGAAGFRIARKRWDAFTEAFDRAIREAYSPEELRPTVDIDWVVEPTEARSILSELEALQPFGNGNAEPNFLIEGIEVDDVDRFGDGGRHAKVRPAGTDALSVIDWDGGETLGALETPATIDVVGTLGMDTFEGRPALAVEDWRVVGEAG